MRPPEWTTYPPNDTPYVNYEVKFVIMPHVYVPLSDWGRGDTMPVERPWDEMDLAEVVSTVSVTWHNRPWPGRLSPGEIHPGVARQEITVVTLSVGRSRGWLVPLYLSRVPPSVVSWVGSRDSRPREAREVDNHVYPHKEPFERGLWIPSCE